MRCSDEVKSSTTSMTAVPKPLRFLRPHYGTLRDYYRDSVEQVRPNASPRVLSPQPSPSLPSSTSSSPAAQSKSVNRALFAAVVSVLAMTTAPPEDRETLKHCLSASDLSLVDLWGHEYLRHLAAEISLEYDDRVDRRAPTDDLMSLVRVIVPEHMRNNAEPEAVDLLLEVEAIEQVVDHVPEASCSRTCLYLVSCSPYLPSPENLQVTEGVYQSARRNSAVSRRRREGGGGMETGRYEE